MPILVVALVILTTVLAAAFLVPRFVPRHVQLADRPDRPRAFGRDMAWLAIRTENPRSVAAALGLSNLRPANWNSGIGAIYDPEISDRLVFLSPPIEGWTLIAGESLPLPAGRMFIDKLTPLLRRLGKEYSRVQYFANFPIIDLYGWARVEKHRAVRVFSIGEAGVIWDEGKRSREERRLGLSFVDIRGIRDRYGDVGGELQLHPTEQHVFALADAWSVNPAAIEAFAAPLGVGWIADAPRSWRPERARKVA